MYSSTSLKQSQINAQTTKEIGSNTLDALSDPFVPLVAVCVLDGVDVADELVLEVEDEVPPFRIQEALTVRIYPVAQKVQ